MWQSGFRCEAARVTSSLTEKQSLRKHYRALRAAQSSQDYEAKCERIAEQFQELDGLRDAQCIYTYLEFQVEVRTSGIAEQLLRDRKRVLTTGADHKRAPAETLCELTWVGGQLIQTPLATTDIAQIDLFLVPGIVWDRLGYRVGFGGGYFDRLLASARADALKVGLAFEFQLIESVPREAWDIPVDVLITETRLHACTPALPREGAFSNPPPATD